MRTAKRCRSDEAAPKKTSRKTKAQLVDELDGLRRQALELKGPRDDRGPSAASQADHDCPLLPEALDALADGIVIFDSDERLVLCNARYREIYRAIPQPLVPGLRLEEYGLG